MNKNNLKNFMIGDIKDRLFTKDYKSLENNLGFDSSLNHLNLQLNELNRKVFKYFENLTNTRIGLSNYYFANNIESFKIYKGRKDELMQELGIISSYKRAEEFKKACKDHPEALKLAERMVKQIMQFADKSLTMRKKIHLKKIITESITLDFFLKNPNLIEEINSLSWFETKNLDFILTLEEDGFLNFIKEQKENLSDGNKYFNNFEKVLRTKPYLWISTLNSWNPKYYEIENKKFLKNLETFLKYIRHDTVRVSMQNIWIESPKGKFRCLCVPNFSYRWICRLWNDALSFYVKAKIKKEFHGFIYGRGCMTWWKNFIMNEYDKKYPHIFEFDLASFFPNVNKKSAYEALLYFDVPEKISRHLIELISGEIKESQEFPNKECYYEEILNKKYRETNRNLPMGNPLCPLLSSLVLYKHWDELGWNTENIKVTGYADDNLLLLTDEGLNQLNNEKNIENLINNHYKGIIVEPAKSKWIKKEGKWLHPLKSLGLQLNKDSSLQGKTRGNDKRKPSNLLFEIELEEQGKLINLEVLRKERKLFDEYFGLIQSRLYEGSFQSEEYKKEDFFSKLEDETFAVQFLKLNRKNIEKKNLNEKNISSHLSAELIRYLIPKVKPVDIKMTKRKPLWKESDDNLYFKKYKELSQEIENIPVRESWEYYNMKQNFPPHLLLTPYKLK